MERDRAMLIADRHQPPPLWRLLRIRRCPTCHCRWPCPRYLDARAVLLGNDRIDVAALIRRNSRWPS
ncbi:hypothetical protein ACIBJE_12925 [Micromonospora sp. NPDC050187]|uniref:hypothetical protein n=1 Tax=Micromonospora sp. NPDC050187 TaxID=3364277 RepID=UPI003797AA1C